MRRIALLAASMLLCGFVPPRFERRARSANVRVPDVGQTYSSINTIECLGWPSDDIKKAAGSGAWGAWHPENGDVGVALSRGTEAPWASRADSAAGARSGSRCRAHEPIQR